MPSSEVERLLMLKNELTRTTHTPGWTYIKQIKNNVIQKAIQEAISEDDETKGAVLRRKAKAMQDGLNDLFNAIEQTMTFTTDQEPEWFTQLGFEAEVAA